MSPGNRMTTVDRLARVATAQIYRTIQRSTSPVHSQQVLVAARIVALLPARGCSSVGRAVALQAIGQEFESPQLHQIMRLQPSDT